MVGTNRRRRWKWLQTRWPGWVPVTILIGVTLATGIALGIRLAGRIYESLPTKAAQDIQVYFSPDGGCTAAIVKQIETARECVYVQAYAFTSPAIAQALAAAHDRAVEVIVILGKSQATAKYSGKQPGN